MDRVVILMRVFGWSLAAVALSGATREPLRAQEQQRIIMAMDELRADVKEIRAILEQQTTIAEIKELGGRAAYDEETPDRSVIEVDLGTFVERDKVVADGVLKRMKVWTRLRSLNLTGAQITDAGLANVKGMKGLQRLQLGQTKVTDAGLAYLVGLTELELLNLSDVKVTDRGLQHLKALTELRSLGMGSYFNGGGITDAGLTNLKDLTKLESLSLNGAKITGAGLEHLKGLTNLESLELEKTGVDDAGLDHLKGLTKLRLLEVGDTKVTDEGVKRLRQMLPCCEIRRTSRPAARMTPFGPTA